MKFRNILWAGIFLALTAVGCQRDPISPDGGGLITDTTGISGNVSGVWSRGTTYKVTGHLEIPEGQSLTIQPGVKVIMCDSIIQPEFIIKGNLYCLGTASDPISITVPDGWKTSYHNYGNLWGGLVAANTSQDIVLQHVNLDYGGAATTEQSPSVKEGLYKAVGGEHLPALYYPNVKGTLIVMDCKFSHFYDDAIYVDGGRTIIAGNSLDAIGGPSDDGINLKSGVTADLAFNFIYSPNTSGLKFSNDGGRSPQLYVVCYNNTIINGGWRRPTIKGGSIWLEAGAHADLYNNLIVNDRFGIKRDKGNPEDSRSRFYHTFYYGYDQETVDNFQPSDEIIGGIDDVIGTKAGENDPGLVNYPLSTDRYNSVLDPAWDFHLRAGSPALGGGVANFTRNFADGIPVNGVIYTSPDPAGYIGAFGMK